MKKTTKFIALGLVAIMSLAMFTGCSNSDGGDAAGGDFDTSSEIGVLTVKMVPEQEAHLSNCLVSSRKMKTARL